MNFMYTVNCERVESVFCFCFSVRGIKRWSVIRGISLRPLCYLVLNCFFSIMLSWSLPSLFIACSITLFSTKIEALE